MYDGNDPLSYSLSFDLCSEEILIMQEFMGIRILLVWRILEECCTKAGATKVLFYVTISSVTIPASNGLLRRQNL